VFPPSCVACRALCSPTCSCTWGSLDSHEFVTYTTSLPQEKALGQTIHVNRTWTVHINRIWIFPVPCFQSLIDDIDLQSAFGPARRLFSVSCSASACSRLHSDRAQTIVAQTSRTLEGRTVAVQHIARRWRNQYQHRLLSPCPRSLLRPPPVRPTTRVEPAGPQFRPSASTSMQTQ
jgi:hypothetical protein